MDCIDPVKFLRLPTNAIPSDPTNKASAFDVKNPAIIFTITEIELSEATLTKTFVFMYSKNFFN